MQPTQLSRLLSRESRSRVLEHVRREGQTGDWSGWISQGQHSGLRAWLRQPHHKLPTTQSVATTSPATRPQQPHSFVQKPESERLCCDHQLSVELNHCMELNTSAVIAKRHVCRALENKDVCLQTRSARYLWIQQGPDGISFSRSSTCRQKMQSMRQSRHPAVMTWRPS